MEMQVWTRAGGAAAAVLAGCLAAAQTCPNAECDPALLQRRSITAPLLRGAPPAIDGRIDDAAWEQAAVARDFIQSRPRPAAPASLPSEARVLCDARALYVALRYDDPRPDTVQAPLLRRDDEITSDWAFVEIDSRHDRRTGFSFGVNPRGVQADGAWVSDTGYDGSWNAVWEAAAARTPSGWSAELRIPFSQLPFAVPQGASEIVWGINFYRHSPSHGESSNWSPRFQGLPGIVSNFNDLRLPAPRSVRRSEATPYAAAGTGEGGNGRDLDALRAGADLKAGLGPRFMLTATVLPDFGQVEADPSQVNLTAFELFQPERRPFFLEGLDLFRFDTGLGFSSRGISFADEGPFYSRRVGRAPRPWPAAGGSVDDVAGATTLLGAAKLSGQTGGWALGVFTAATRSEGARGHDAGGRPVSWPAEAASLVTVARAVRTLRQGEGELGLFTAGLRRLGLAGLGERDVREAVVGGAELRLRFGERRYEARTWVLGSRLAGSPEAIARAARSPLHLLGRPGGPPAPGAGAAALDGVSAEARLSRVAGALQWDVVARAVSPGFDANETGFQRNTDWLLLAGAWKYQRFTPDRAVRAWTVGSRSLGAGWTFEGESRARVVDAYVSLDLRNHWTALVSALHELGALSPTWLRGGPALRLPPRDAIALSLVTDQRRPTYASLDASASAEHGSGSRALNLAPLLNVRASDRVQWSLGAALGDETVGWQPLSRLDTQDAARGLVARVRQTTLALTVRADLTFSPRLALQLYAQPFATRGRYGAYQVLADARAAQAAARFAPVEAPPDELRPGDALDRALSASLVARWEFRPGSFVTLVGTQARAGSLSELGRSPAFALAGLLGERPHTALLVKLSRRFGS